MSAIYRLGHELGESLRRALCPPHPWGELCGEKERSDAD